MEIEDPDYMEYLKHKQDFENYLKNKGFYFREVLGDGNCFFRSVADQMENNQCNHFKYRKLAVEFLRDNQSHFQNFLTNFEGTFRDCLSIMIKNGTWRGHLEILALSSSLKVSFHLYRDDKGVNIVDGCGITNPKILYLAFNQARSHYSSIKN